MKATLEFKLPEEKYEHDLALHGGDWRDVVAVLHMGIRSARKHGHYYANAEEALDDVWNTLHYEMMEHGLSLD